MLAYTYVEKGKFKLLDKTGSKTFRCKRCDCACYHVQHTAAVIFISSTVLYPGQFRELQWAMRWWESWKKQEKM